MTNPVANSISVSRECPACVLVNSAAGGGRAKAYLPRIQKLFTDLRFPAEFVLTGSAEELAAKVQQAITNHYKFLIAMGGDGTFHGLVNAATGEDVVLGILPAGGGNDFAAGLGLPRDPIAAVRAIAGGQPRWVDLIRASTADGRTQLYAGGGGVGLDAEAARHASGAYRHIPGRFRYIASALHALAGYAPLGVNIDFPGSDLSPIKAKALLAAVLNTPTYGAGLRLAPEADMHDGFLDVVLIEELSLFGVLALLPRLMVSGELRSSRVKRWRAQRVRFMTDQPAMLHGDGEILGPTPVEIEVVPRAMRVLAPAAP